MRARKQLVVLITAMLALAGIPVAPGMAGVVPDTSEVPYAYTAQYPGSPLYTRSYHFYDPVDASVVLNDPTKVLVADAGFRKVLTVSNAGEETSFSVAATDYPWLDTPVAVASAPDGTFYVALDEGSSYPTRIVRCSAAGVPLASWGTRGSGPGQLSSGWSSPGYAHGMACDSAGNLLVADRDNGCVHKFSPTGALLDTIDAGSTGLSDMTAPADVAVDASGTAWIGDQYASSVFAVRSDGGTGSIDTTSPVLTVAAGPHRVYFADLWNVWGFVPYGGQVWSATKADGVDVYPFALAAYHSGSMVYGVSRGKLAGNRHVWALNKDNGSTVIAWRSWQTAVPGLQEPADVAVGPGGTIYVADQLNYRVRGFNPSTGECIYSQGGQGSGLGEYQNGPSAVAVDATGSVYVLDDLGSRVEVFDSALGYQSYFNVPYYSEDIEVGPDGSVYVADGGDDQIRVYRGSVLATSWGQAGNGQGQLNGPSYLALTRDGSHIWVSGVYYTSLFTTAGVYTGISIENGDGSLGQGTRAIAVDSSNRLVMFDHARIEDFVDGETVTRDVVRLERYSATGAGPVPFGSLGFGDTQFAWVSGMEFGPDGSLFVADLYNDRVQRFSPLQDSQAPVTEIVWPQDWRAYVPWEVSVELDAIDGNSGVAHTFYSLSGATTQTVTTYTADFSITAEGTTTITYYSVDASGHAETPKVWYAWRDFSPPGLTPSISEGQTFSGATTVTLSATDAGSGVDFIDWKLDDGSIVRTDGAVAQVPVTGSGSHTIYYKPTDNAGNTWPAYDDVMLSIEAESVAIAGATRFGTAVQMSQQMYESADTVVIASGRGYADALGAAALAGAYDAPLLLTEPTSLPGDVAAEIGRLGATKAFIVGGTGAVNDAVGGAISVAVGGDMTRLAGTTRYNTARLVFDEVQARYDDLGPGLDGRVFVVCGTNFPDALSASALSAARGWPILLTPPTSLSADTLAVLQDPDVTDVTVVGGTGAVSDAVYGQIRNEVGVSHIERRAGADRYATALLVVDLAESAGLTWDGVCFATGQNYADALAGGPFAASSNTFVALTPSTSLYPALGTRLAAERSGIGSVTFLGGTGALNDTVRDAVMDILNQ